MYYWYARYTFREYVQYNTMHGLMVAYAFCNIMDETMSLGVTFVAYDSSS